MSIHGYELSDLINKLTLNGKINNVDTSNFIILKNELSIITKEDLFINQVDKIIYVETRKDKGRCICTKCLTYVNTFECNGDNFNLGSFCIRRIILELYNTYTRTSDSDILHHILRIIEKAKIWSDDIEEAEKRIKRYDREFKKYGKTCIQCNSKYIYRGLDTIREENCEACYNLKTCMDCKKYDSKITSYRKRCMKCWLTSIGKTRCAKDYCNKMIDNKYKYCYNCIKK